MSHESMPELEPEITKTQESPVVAEGQKDISPEESLKQQLRTAMVNRISAEETEKFMEGEETKVKIALSELFEILPHHRKTDKKEVLSLIELTPLSSMVGPVQEMFANEIMKQKLCELPKAEFIKAGMKELSSQILANADMKSTIPTIERIRAEENRLQNGQAEDFENKIAA